MGFEILQNKKYIKEEIKGLQKGKELGFKQIVTSYNISSLCPIRF